jgi:hypothetical protein
MVNPVDPFLPESASLPPRGPVLRLDRDRGRKGVTPASVL